MTTSDIQTWRYRVKINGTWEGDAMKLEIDDLRSALQSQAERIAELERESETYAKAYGLAIVEHDTLRYELKTAQEGWRCECSPDDACRFAQERDDLRSHLAESTSNHEACKSANSMLLDTIAEIEKTEPVAWVRYAENGNIQIWTSAPDHAVRLAKEYGEPLTPFYTRPVPAQDVTELVEALEKLARLGNGEHYGNSDGNMIARTALSKYKGAK